MRRNNLVVLSLLASVACMSGCAGFRAPVVEVQAVTPPDALLTNCEHAPRPQGTKVSDLAQALINERAVLEGCDWGDKAALREWAAGVKPGPTPK